MQPSTIAKIALWLLWFGVVVYAFGFAPPDNVPETINLIQRLVTGQIAGINPLVVALFNIMGVFPLMYAAILLFDGRTQAVRAYPFVLASLVVGAFAILPYLALRQVNLAFSGQKNWLLRLLDSRWYGVGMAIVSMLLVGYGLTQGNWADFAAQWQTSRFIHVMSLDFCLLCFLFPLIMQDDMVRRGWHSGSIVWAVSLLPFLGAAFYLLVRPAINDTTHPLSQSEIAS